MKNIRTDLALEAHEIWKKNSREQTELKGVIAREDNICGMAVHRVEILNKEGERAIGKPCGNYVTIELPNLSNREEREFHDGIKAVACEISRLIPSGAENILIAGLGNRGITPDAVGEAVAEKVIVTRHLVENLPEYFNAFKKVSAITPGVLGITGVESADIIAGVAAKIRPDLIMVIDALAAGEISRLCNTVQITDTGITPGSGVGNTRKAIDKRTLGVPVIAIGVPTVVDVASLLPGGDNIPQSLMVTPKEIDINIRDVGKIIGYGINKAITPGLSIAEMEMFLG